MTKKNLIKMMKGATLGVAMLGLSASAALADEFTLKNNYQRGVVEVHENDKYQFDWSNSLMQGRDEFNVYHGDNELGFGYNNQVFDCNNLNGYQSNQRNEIASICSVLPEMVGVFYEKQLANQLKSQNQRLRNSILGNMKLSDDDWNNAGKIR